MQAPHCEHLDGGPFDPHALVNSVMIRRTYVGSRRGIGARKRAISARPPNPIIDRVFGCTEANEAHSYFADHGPLGKVVIIGN